MISVVIPIYNRRNNLRLCLTALEKQTVEDFEVVVADDGSDDDPLGVLHEFKDRLTRRYIWHDRAGTRIALTRNEGSRIAIGDLLLYIDSDILLNPSAIGHYMNIHRANPGVVVAGRYDWLPPQQVTVYDVHYNWGRITRGEMTPLPIQGAPLGLQGIDPRLVNPNLFNSSVVHYGPYCLSTFSGNLLVPKSLWEAIGGWNEDLVGHGGEDAEFGMRLQERKVPIIFSDEVIGYHVYHDRNQARNEEEVATNCCQIAEVHDLHSLGVRLGGPGEYPLEYCEEVDHV